MVPTQHLLELLQNATPLPEILQQIPDLDFLSYLQALMESKELKRNEIIAKTNIQRKQKTYGNQEHPNPEG